MYIKRRINILELLKKKPLRIHVRVHLTSIYCVPPCARRVPVERLMGMTEFLLFGSRIRVYGFQTLYITVVVKVKVNWCSKSRGEETKMPVLSKRNFRAQESGRTLTCRFGS